MNKSSKPVAIVTGAGTGIGAAIAHKLAQRGWNLAITWSRSREAAEQTAAALESTGAEVLLAQADIAVDADCRRVAEDVEARWGRIDALVNNAGVTRFCPPEDLDGLQADDFNFIMGVNVVGTFQMTRACAPALKRSGRGTVLNISSQAGFTGLGSSIAYAASKAALNNMTLALARTLAPDIRVNALCPGFVNTQWVQGEMDAGTYQRFRRRVDAITPLGRMTEAGDVAETACFFITTDAPITGELLGIDGGNHLTVSAPDFQP